MINLLVIALAIPFTETLLWGRGAEFLSDRFKININNTNKTRIELIVIFIVLAALFALFHSTARQLEFNSMVVVAIMMGLTLFLIAMRDGDLRAGLFLHILANGVAALILIKQGGSLTLGIIPLLLINSPNLNRVNKLFIFKLKSPEIKNEIK